MGERIVKEEVARRASCHVRVNNTVISRRTNGRARTLAPAPEFPVVPSRQAARVDTGSVPLLRHAPMGVVE